MATSRKPSPKDNPLELEVLIPTRTLWRGKVKKVRAEGLQGSFCLLPHHANLVTGLVTGILEWEDEEGTYSHTGVDGGVLVKWGNLVFAAAHRAVAADGLEGLKEKMRQEFAQADERQRLARTALARLEADTMRRLAHLART